MKLINSNLAKLLLTSSSLLLGSYTYAAVAINGAIESITKETNGNVTIVGYACEVGKKAQPMIYLGDVGAKYDTEKNSLVFKSNISYHNHNNSLTPNMDSTDLYAADKCNLKFSAMEPKIKYRFKYTLMKDVAEAHGQRSPFLMVYGSDEVAQLLHKSNFSQRLPYRQIVGNEESITQTILDSVETPAGDVLIKGKVCVADKNATRPALNLRIRNNSTLKWEKLVQGTDYVVTMGLPTPGFCIQEGSKGGGFELLIKSSSRIMKDPANPKLANKDYLGAVISTDFSSPTGGVDQWIGASMRRFLPRYEHY